MRALIFCIFLFQTTAFAKLNVLTTTSNLKSIVELIGGNKVKVESFAKGSQDPHYLQAKPSYSFKASKADLLVSIGLSLEDAWLPLIVRGSRNPKLRIGESARLVTSEFVDLLEATNKQVSRAEGDVHSEGNPHYMLSPRRSILVAKAVTDKLSSLDKVNKKYYVNNFNEFKKKMIESILKWRGLIKRNIKVITYHKTLTYFYNDFDILNVDVLEPKPGVPPTAFHIMKVIKKIKLNKIKNVLVENYFASTIANRIKVEVKNIKVSNVAVAVGGKKGINNIFDLYDSIIQELRESE